MTAFIDWNVNPEIFRIGNFAIRWYGLLFASAFLFGYLIMSKFFKKEGIRIEVLDKLTIYMAIGTIIGARLGHCLFYEPSYYLSHPVEILMIWKGGLASHGAAIGILIALYLFAKSEKKPFLWVVDRIVIVTALGGFFIRTGNLMNSEIYGIETTLPWGFVFIRNAEVVPKHPTQIYEALCYLIIFGILYLIYIQRKAEVKGGLLFGLFLILVFLARFLIEFIKEDQVGFESGMTLNMGQWLSIPFILTGIGLVIRSVPYKNKNNE
ncbi:MAG: prolipoprotein diacylglyceryl transferase [Bacteroidales bacterium]|nr:MAG: prolipoprotein diacylglyceryl transferase [Bacteroidales bacterium]